MVLAGRVRCFGRPRAARLPIFAVPNFGAHASLGTADFATAAASSLHSHVSTPTISVRFDEFAKFNLDL